MPLKTEPGLDKVSLRKAENDVRGIYGLSWVWDYGQRGWEARFFLRQSLCDRLGSGKKVSCGSFILPDLPLTVVEPT